jgi:hypothetical protein
MKQWKFAIKIGDLHAKARRGELTPNELGEAVAARLRASLAYKTRFREPLEGIADQFGGADDLDEYDDVLEQLYDWGDVDKTCWIDTFDPPIAKETEQP